MPSVASNKAKVAKRVIEVLDFFDEEHPQATVMDIVRRFNRPQSSTSELLSSLVELGLLYKDPHLRSYSPTPRAAMLGTGVQPRFVRDGRLPSLIDRLAAQTGLGVAMFGMVGLNVQIFSWRAGLQKLRTTGGAGLCGGLQEKLSDSAAGWLLLSTVPQPRREGVIRRLNAEAPTERKFAFAGMAAHIQQCRDAGHATGPAGFNASAHATAVLVPAQAENQPLAIGFIYEPSERLDPAALLRCLTDAVTRCIEEQDPARDSVQPLFNAA
jgi:DNA-binding IclR family transcriptional regulator